MDNRLATLRRTLRLHFNWLIVKLLGKDSLSKEELSELKDYGRLSLGDEVSLIERSFALGRESALSKKSEYKDLDLEKLSKLQKRKYSSVEELAIREAKLHTARRIQRLADEASADAYNRVNKATRDLVDDATTKDILTDEVALGVAEKKTRQQLATSIANKLGRDFSADMKKLAVTEMHRAKQRGAAMAIANKVGIYQRSNGVDSKVSVVPNKGACKDCLNLYLDEGGNPKVFTLKSLLAQGSNADEGVSHARGAGGIHTGWKPVMPPAHPNCYCELTYVPPGMAWENGKLKVVDELRYKESISKAYDSSTMSATIKPKGGESYQKNEPPKPGSIPGVAAPGNTAGPGRPPDPSSGPKRVLVDCPFNGGDDCRQHGGDGAMQHYFDGKIMQKHMQYQPSQPGAPEEQKTPEQVAAEMEGINKYTHTEDYASKTLDHVERGEIVSSKNIADVKGAKKGVTQGTKKVGIKDNGSSCTKPTAEGQNGDDVRHEVGAYQAFTVLGSNLCPVTGKRQINGVLNSSQAWADGHDPAASVLGVMNSDELITSLKEKSPKWEKVRGQMEEMVVMDLIICNSDRHMENFLLTPELDNVVAIDHGFSFNPGMTSFYSEVFQGFNSTHHHVHLTDPMDHRFNNISLGDMSKNLSGNLQEWKVDQTYLRMRYVQSVAAENDGRLFYHEFENTKRETALTSNEKFEKFVFDFIDNYSEDPSSPEYSAAVKFAKDGVLMPTEDTGLASREEERRLGEQFRYEMEQRRAIFEKEQKIRGETSFRDKQKKEYEAWENKRRIEYYREADLLEKESKAALAEATKASFSMRGLKVELTKLLKEGKEEDPSLPYLFSSIAKFEERYNAANKEMDSLAKQKDELWDDLMQDQLDRKAEIMATAIPPGQEKAFARLQHQLEMAQLPPDMRETLPAPPAPEKPVITAGDIESNKRRLAVEKWTEDQKKKG
jgi:hypothetical protein